VNHAILLPTCDAYAPVADFTAERLDAWWPGHPEVFVCGLAGAPPLPDRHLPLTADPRDWIGIVLDAVGDLQARGFDWLYLILDDHPPFGPCNADFLNRRLPENARALNAIQVNLLGWDQYQPQEGSVLGREHLYWQRNSPAFRWKFSLHPGYWHVVTLQTMLRELRAQTPDALSARAFEGQMDSACRAFDPHLLERTYRVRGDRFAAGRGWFEARVPRAVTRRFIQLAHLVAHLGGASARTRLETALVPYCRYISGPYPMFWSGLVRQGRLHEEALRVLVWSGHHELADDVRRRVLALAARQNAPMPQGSH
jgi:hypothetical protein